VNWAYLAGFIDGEGCLGLRRVKTTIRPRITITNTNKEVLELIRGFVGSGSICKSRTKGEGWKCAYRWQLEGKQSIGKVIDGVLPHLIVKREQGIVLKRFIDTIQEKSHRLRPEVIIERELLLETMKQLNKKGNAA
jgi:hypothetical protein